MEAIIRKKIFYLLKFYFCDFLFVESYSLFSIDFFFFEDVLNIFSKDDDFDFLQVGIQSNLMVPGIY